MAQILAEFDGACRVLSGSSTHRLRNEIASFEHEILRLSDYDKRAAVTPAHKHIDAGTHRPRQDWHL